VFAAGFGLLVAFGLLMLGLAAFVGMIVLVILSMGHP